MEHREPPRSAAEDQPTRPVAPAPRVPFALSSSLLASRPGRLAVRRVRAWPAIAIASGLIAGCFLLYLLVGATLAWLGRQPAYQVPFGTIELDPPPPPWYRGGGSEFLESVRRRARMPATIAVLQLKPHELERSFERNSPWIEDVTRIWYRPDGIRVGLLYRRPVALVVTGDPRPYLVDGSAVILPPDDLDVDLETFAKEQGLITIKGLGLVAPANPEPGITWQPRAGVTDPAPGNDRIPSAARLASFLMDKLRTVDRTKEPALDIGYVNPMDPEGRGLFIWNAESTYILWGEAPGEESPGSLTAEEKWEKLREWSRSAKARVVPTRDYWQITGAGLVHQEFREEAQSARMAGPARDGSTIRTKGPGHSP